jgi:GNAT superfamily N-acetyltransferase
MKLTDLREMAPPPESMRGQTLYHGVDKQEQAEFIMKHGIVPPEGPQGRSPMAPVAGRVYLTPNLNYGIIYALGGAYAGHTLPDEHMAHRDRYGYLFVIDGKDIQNDIQPDEDEVGSVLHYILNRQKPESKYYRDRHEYQFIMNVLNNQDLVDNLFNLANHYLTSNQIDNIKYGEYFEYARSGKKLLKIMSNESKLALIRAGAHIAHEGAIWPKEMWRIDKARSGKITKSNFFQIAEKVWERPQQIQESMPRTLYHGTTIDNARYAEPYGLEPRVGDFVQNAYGLGGEADAREMGYYPLVFAADKPELGKAINAIVHHVATKLGKRSITPQEFLNHGALVVLKHKENRFAHRDVDRDQDDYPQQVEPGDYYTDYHQKGDFILTGSKLKRVLERLGLWPYPHGQIEWPDHIYTDDGFPQPVKKRKRLMVKWMAEKSLTEEVHVATKFWFNVKAKKFEGWPVRFSNVDHGAPHHDEYLMMNPQKFGLQPGEDKDGAEFSTEAFEAGWVRGMISSIGDLYLECTDREDAKATIRYLLSRKLVDRRALDNVHLDMEKIGSVRLGSRGEVSQFLSEGDQINEVHYQDMFPPRFESFHKKYRTKVRRKEINPDHYWVQFRNFAEDKLDRTAFENPTHTDPMGVYAYPLRYVLQHPADIWYGAAARYLRVIRNTAKNPLDLKELNDLGWGRIENLLWRMGLNLNKSDLRWIKRQYQWSGKYAPVLTFMRAMQIKFNDEPTEDGWGQKKWPMRSAKEQTQLLLKAGYDAVIDQGTGAINQREPEQAVFLTRASFRVEETFDLRRGKGETDHMTINQPGSNREFVRKFGQMIATALDDKLTDKRETSNLMGWTYMWTKKGRRIEIQIERPEHYYKTRGPLEKPHKYDRKHTNHVIEVNVRTEFGDIEVAERYGRAKLDEIVQDIAHRYRRLQVEQKQTSWTPQDRAGFHAQQERERYEMIGNRMRAEQDMPPIRYDEMMRLKDQGLNVFGVPLAKARMLHWKELWQRHNANPANPKMKLKQFIDQQEAELAASKMVAEGARGDLPTQYSFHNDVTGHHHGQTDGTLYFYDRATAGDDWPPRRVVGKLDWTKYQGKVFINYIRVTPEFQRRGIGKALVNELKKEFPEEEVVWTNTTPEGTALRKSMP